MTHSEAEFYQGSKGQLFRLVRTPETVHGHIIYIAPLFEEANQTRHVVTRAALGAYALGFQSIIFDHFGTGDSAGVLLDASLAIWQKDIYLQIADIRKQSCHNITLCAPLSAALLLNDDITHSVDCLQLWQPEFNGKKFIQQFKRLALAANLSSGNVAQSVEHKQMQCIAGYTVSDDLLAEISAQNSQRLSSVDAACDWFEWQVQGSELPLGRVNQRKAVQNNITANMHCYVIYDDKFWQMTALHIPQQLLTKLAEVLQRMRDAIGIKQASQAMRITQHNPHSQTCIDSASNHHVTLTKEKPIIFTSRDRQLMAMEHGAHIQSEKGLLMIVGGPQTRVGSHRLFVFLARALAEQGIHVFRFDYTGAGDSEGTLTPFTDIQADIDAAIATFYQSQPQIKHLTLWGLCDAASAALLYIQQAKEQRICQLVLVNPWVRQQATQAQVYLKSYYLKRILSKNFWQKLFRGQVKVLGAAKEIQELHQQSHSSALSQSEESDFVDKMYQGFALFHGKAHIILSGNDLTADEFRLLTSTDKKWRTLMQDKTVNLQMVAEANHTFASQLWQAELLKQTLFALNKH